MSDIQKVILTYQARCEKGVQQAEPGSAESMAYAPLLEVFKKYQSNPNPIDLMFALKDAAVHQALPLAPRELHMKGQQAQQIAETIVDDFQHDAGLGGASFRLKFR